MKRLQGICMLVCCGATCLFADFSYERSSKITGGALAGAMKVVGVFSKKAREPIRSTVLVKGDRMADLTEDHANIVDLGSETITEVDFHKKTYSVMTFAEMKQAMEKMMERAKSQQNDQKVDVKFKASTKDTGQKKEIGGLNTREVILTIEMESTDKESGKKGAMTVTADMWLAPDVPGYNEVKSFYKRMAQKIDWSPGDVFGGQTQFAKAFADVRVEAAKLNGVPVYEVISMGATGEGQQQASASSSREQPEESPSIKGAIGHLGGFGGFGKKKKKEPEQKPAAEPETTSAVLMELTSESSGFSTAGIDASKLEVPAGFKKVDSDLARMLRKQEQ